ncbi:MAG: hypothetical protein K0S04_1300 [Herbinix sp.]|jgi:flagellar hook-associated protein 2|nr:hypothetical protein [Herbinix sp.]
MAVRMTGLISNMDTESIIASLMSAQKTKQTKIENKITKLEWKQERWKDLNTKLFKFYSDSLSKFRFQSNFVTKKVTSSDEAVATVTTSSSTAEGNHMLKVSQLASSQFVTSAQLKETDNNGLAISSKTLLKDLGMTEGNKISVTVGSTQKDITVTGDTTVESFLSELKDAGLNASYDTTQRRFFISSKQSGENSAFTLTADIPDDLKNLGLSTITKKEETSDEGIKTTTYIASDDVTIIQPKDAKYNYNGVDFTSSTNNISVNGLSITLKGLTKDDAPVSINVTKDTKVVYDMVKSFVTAYNDLLKEMNTNYYADSARSFQPLSDDDKESMSDEEIKKWETKIKDSLLRRDGTLSTLSTEMRTQLGGSVEVNGKSYSLSTYGIKTSSDYTEKGLLHIDGDATDSLVSGNADKLMEALEKDPDTVVTVLTQLAGKLYNKLGENMGGTKLRSALTFYNDKEMKDTLTDYKDELKIMETKLKDMEDRYYKQFSAMETALAKMNSQSSALTSMLGTNQ